MIKLLPLSDNFQIKSAIFHLTLSRPKVELSQSPNPAPAFKVENPGLRPCTCVCLPPTLFGKWIVLKFSKQSPRAAPSLLLTAGPSAYPSHPPSNIKKERTFPAAYDLHLTAVIHLLPTARL